MSASFTCSVLAAALLAQSSPDPSQPDRPRFRDAAEPRDVNLVRYRLVEPGQDPNDVPATGPLGIRVQYPAGVPQGVTVVGFGPDSPGWDSGVRPGEQILEIDGSPVGLLNGRYYEPADLVRPGASGPADALVSYADVTGARRYYHLPLAGPATAPRRPLGRENAESVVRHFARKQLIPGRFDRHSNWELGASITYVPGGATIVAVKPNGAAERAGLRVGDQILEVDGGPVGKFGRRVYETWPRFDRSEDGTVELLIGTTDEQSGEVRYYYPEVPLDPRTGPA